MALISGYGLTRGGGRETWRGLAAVPRHPRDGRRRRLPAARRVGRREEPGDRLEDGDPGTGPLEPDCLGRPHLRQHVDQRQEGREPRRSGCYGDVRPSLDDTAHEWRVYCLDKKTGAVRWQQSVLKAVPKIKRHTKATHANSTLATDGERLIAFFGSEGLYAYDLKGKLLWKKDLGVLDAGWFTDPSAQWETGSSPILHDNVVVIQADVQKGSFLGAFDARNGRELWRVARKRRADVGHADGAQVNGRDAARRQRLAPHRRLRLQDRQGNLEADRRRRHPRCRRRSSTTG